jgi:gamma-glutamylcysteine synthetase
MRQGFIQTASKIVRSEDDFVRSSGELCCGLEIEVPLVKRDFSLASQQCRDTIVTNNASWAKVELAAHQLEIVHEPAVNLTAESVRELENRFEPIFQTLEKGLRAEDMQIVRIGSYPLVALDCIPHTNGKAQYAKYQSCPQWHRDHQRQDCVACLPEIEPVDVSNPFLVGLLNAVHVNLDADSFADAIDKLNRSLMLCPLALALGANAPYLDFRHSGYADVRNVAWERSHDTRSPEELRHGRLTRIGLPARYYQDVNDYFNRILSYPFVMTDDLALEDPFAVGNGIYWRDARLKFFRDKRKIAVEFRPVSLQPSLAEDVAMAMFYIGRLTWSQHYQEPLLPLHLVHENKQEAMRRGTHARLISWFKDKWTHADGPTVLRRELERAHEGLLRRGESANNIRNSFAILKERIALGTPAERLMRSVQALERSSPTFNLERRRAALIESLYSLGLASRL